MKEIAVVPRLPVPGVAPGLDQPLDKLEDQLLPVEEDELPQGVLDLMAALVVRHRPMTGTGANEALPSTHLSARVDVMRPAPPPRVGLPASVLPAASVSPSPAASVSASPSPSPSPMVSQRGEQVAVTIAKGINPSATPEPLPLIDRPSQAIEPSSVEPQSPSSEPAIANGDVELPVAVSTAVVLRNAPSATPVLSVPSPPMPLAPSPEITVEELVSTDRDFLQVPFNKGTASGQVTITRASGESMPNLVLSPSNVQVFEHLKEPFEQVHDNHWRLTETTDEQPRHGSHQAPDEEQEEPEELPA